MIGNSFFSFINLPIKHLWKYDKVIHFSEYFILGILLFYALFESPLSYKKILYSMIFISLIPIIDESIQYFIPTRICSVYDALADYAGFYIGCLFYYILNKVSYG